MKKLLLALSATLGLAAALPAHAQFAKPEAAVKYRKAAMTLMGAHMSRLGAMAQGKVPFDAKLAADNTEVLAAVSKLPWAGFIEGTEKVGNSHAKPEVWKEAAKFKEATERYLGEVGKLEAATKTGNADQIKAAIGAVGKSCKSCHDSFEND